MFPSMFQSKNPCKNSLNRALAVNGANYFWPGPKSKYLILFGVLSILSGCRKTTSASLAGGNVERRPDASGPTMQPRRGICPKAAVQLPGLAVAASVGRSGTCQPIPAQSDLCGGSPISGLCQPPRPPQRAFAGLVAGTASAEPAKAVTGLKAQAGATGVYTVVDALIDAKVAFTSAALVAASDEANATACANQFYAVARSVDRQINPFCILKPAPAAAQNGKLTCAITVAFDRPQTFLEKVCNISAVFRSDSDEVQHIQVLIN